MAMAASRQTSGAKKTKTSATSVKLPPIQKSEEGPTKSQSRKTSAAKLAQSAPATTDDAE